MAGVRHTSCRHCGQDIEGVKPYRRGEWRDRGNNSRCPTRAGDEGQLHQPILAVLVSPLIWTRQRTGVYTGGRYVLRRFVLLNPQWAVEFNGILLASYLQLYEAQQAAQRHWEAHPRG